MFRPCLTVGSKGSNFTRIIFQKRLHESLLWNSTFSDTNFLQTFPVPKVPDSCAICDNFVSVSCYRSWRGEMRTGICLYLAGKMGFHALGLGFITRKTMARMGMGLRFEQDSHCGLAKIWVGKWEQEPQICTRKPPLLCKRSHREVPPKVWLIIILCWRSTICKLPCSAQHASLIVLGVFGKTVYS
jgi:hypothetical protein